MTHVEKLQYWWITAQYNKPSQCSYTVRNPVPLLQEVPFKSWWKMEKEMAISFLVPACFRGKKFFPTTHIAHIAKLTELQQSLICASGLLLPGTAGLAGCWWWGPGSWGWWHSGRGRALTAKYLGRKSGAGWWQWPGTATSPDCQQVRSEEARLRWSQEVKPEKRSQD